VQRFDNGVEVWKQHQNDRGVTQVPFSESGSLIVSPISDIDCTFTMLGGLPVFGTGSRQDHEHIRLMFSRAGKYSLNIYKVARDFEDIADKHLKTMRLLDATAHTNEHGDKCTVAGGPSSSISPGARNGYETASETASSASFSDYSPVLRRANAMWSSSSHRPWGDVGLSATLSGAASPHPPASEAVTPRGSQARTVSFCSEADEDVYNDRRTDEPEGVTDWINSTRGALTLEERVALAEAFRDFCSTRFAAIQDIPLQGPTLAERTLSVTYADAPRDDSSP